MSDSYENDRLTPDAQRLRDLADELDREGQPDLAAATRRAAVEAEGETAGGAVERPDLDPVR